MKQQILAIVTGSLLVFCQAGASDDRLLTDAHIHYSHDAWELIPPAKAVEILRAAGLKKAFVSSSSDEGTQKLYAEAPELIVPVLRPYRKRGELATWMHDATVIEMLTVLVSENRYAGIGEFHAFGDDMELPVLQGIIELAKQNALFLHAHSDADAIRRIFHHNPEAVVLWAHSGFDEPEVIAEMLATYPNLWADLAFRSDHVSGDEIDADWLKLFSEWPRRILLGTDTYTPERWYYVEDHAAMSRKWLALLPVNIAENIAWKNADELLRVSGFLK